MYISRVEVNTEDRIKMRDLTHVGAFHSWVEDSFPYEKDRNIRTRKLWRLDKLNEKQYLILVSSDKPEPALLEKYGVENTAHTKDYDLFLNSLKNGDNVRFRIALNPVTSEASGAGKRGIVKPCLDQASQMQYLLDRAEKNGFILRADEYFISERGVVVLKKSKSPNAKFVKVTYEGKLTIKDIEKFREVLSFGMGKHKAYGFGLMTVIPLID